MAMKGVINYISKRTNLFSSVASENESKSRREIDDSQTESQSSDYDDNNNSLIFQSQRIGTIFSILENRKNTM